jgi:ELP3 family radical SAM enzyme/protein acetyltransferase
MCSIDIEDINKQHKKKTFDENIWQNLLTNFKSQYETFETKKDVIMFQKNMQRKYKISLSNCDLVKLYEELDINNTKIKNLIIKKKQKSDSGVLVITVLTSAHPEYIDEDGNRQIGKFSCKHDCAYCPNEKAHEGNNWTDQPRSYLFSEPAVLRANDNDFDPIKQMNARLSTLKEMGHALDKLEIIVLGGTWSEYPEQYRDDFITKLYYSANIFNNIYKRDILSLEEEIEINENESNIHIIGLTLETRPDTINLDEIKKFRKYNCTRIQLGVQHTDNSVLKKINRGHNIECVYEAIKLLKDNCYKVDIHLMPNLPGSSYEMDVKMLEDSLYDPRIQVDQYKIYPTAIVPWTKIKKWYEEGSYVPYDDLKLYELIKNFKQKVQKWKRLNRIIRDIPSTYISGGYDHKYVNMRQLLQNDMKKNNWSCQCIRCREVANNKVNVDDIKLMVEQYDGSDGEEYFISYETDKYLIGFIRLRLSKNNENRLDILKDMALIRELHVYSNLNNVGNNIDESMQHKGYGKKLVFEAEKIALENGYKKMAIISGTGVRNYYKKLGYELHETYMIKLLYNNNRNCIIQ